MESLRTCGSKATDESTFDCLSLSELWVSASTCSVGTFGCGPMGYTFVFVHATILRATSGSALDAHRS